MSKLALSGVLQGLTTLEVGDLARYKAAVAAGQQLGWCYYFPYLLSKDKAGTPRGAHRGRRGCPVCLPVGRGRRRRSPGPALSSHAPEPGRPRARPAAGQ